MAIDPQRMAAIMQRLQLANQGGNAAPAGPPGGGMMAPQGGAPQGNGVVKSKISGTVIMAPGEGQQGGPPAPVQINGNIRISKPTVGGPPNMVHIEGEITMAPPGGQPPGGQPGAAPQGAPAPQGMPPR